MKKIKILLLSLLMLVTFSSCEVYTTATTQDDIYTETSADIVRSNIDFNLVVRYGTPYYMNGELLYYLYNGLYYYPFYYNNYWYVRTYRRPFLHFDRRPYFRPHRHDYRFSPGHHGFGRPKPYHHSRPMPPTMHRRHRVHTPDIQSHGVPSHSTPPRSHNHGGIDSRQKVQPRHGNFGGRR